MGGLSWNVVRPRIETTLAEIPNLDAVVFEPEGAPVATARTGNAPKMTAGRAALVKLLDGYRNALLDPFVTLLEVHKLAYFMQVAGQPLRLRFEKADYGPYAENLRHVLNAVEGHFIVGYADGGDAPFKELELVPGAAARAARVLDGSPATMKRFDRVADLVEGFESAFGLELLSTVHWVLDQEAPGSHEHLVAQTHAWNDRKRQFSPGQIALAGDVLAAKGWVNASANSAHWAAERRLRTACV